MSESKGPESYRARAELMRMHAKYTSSEKGRFVYLELAAYWDQLAEVAEKSAAVSSDIHEALTPAPPQDQSYGPGAPRR